MRLKQGRNFSDLERTPYGSRWLRVNENQKSVKSVKNNPNPRNWSKTVQYVEKYHFDAIYTVFL